MWLIRDTFNGERCQVITQVADRVYILDEEGYQFTLWKTRVPCLENVTLPAG